ncbi:MAG: Na/Pi cotransporter family protein [Nitrospiraceae bacterium]|nr:Na/Pi cotransporter family protein [Nitrospiraceae bacterium]
MIYINLCGGVLLLLYGIKLVNDGLQSAAGPRIRSLLRSLTSNQLAAVGTGAFITGLIQSSSATSVMLVGFVSAGLMTFRQTLAVILGADIGATLTVQLIAFHVTDYAIALIGLGLAIVLFAKRHQLRTIGDGLLGFGFVFLSIKIMTGAMAPLQQSALFRDVMVALVGSPFTGIVLSALFTAMVHSSAATIGIAIALGANGLIPLEGAIHIVLGANLGTCSTALMASLRAPSEARRVAWAHLLFKLTGVLLILPALLLFERAVTSTGGELVRQIANAHTLFNALMAVCFLPFLGLFAKVVARIVPDSSEEKAFGPKYLDEHVLATPSLALSQATREALRESDIVREMLIDSIKAFQTSDQTLIADIRLKDNQVDMLDRQIRLYLTRLSSSQLTEAHSRREVALLEASRDLENIGDVIDRNLMELAIKRITKGLMFSEEGMNEIILYHKKLVDNFDLAISTFSASDRDLGRRVLRNKEELETLERELIQAHLDRLRKGLRESMETSHIHLDTIGQLARINSLITHIVYPVFEDARSRAREDHFVIGG